jgi:hypothetical protein
MDPTLDGHVRIEAGEGCETVDTYHALWEAQGPEKQLALQHGF